MATALRPVGHEDRLSLVEHLDELRTRIIVSVAVFAAAFAVCLWQDDRILDFLDRPLDRSAFRTGETSKDPLEQAAIFQERQKEVLVELSLLSRELARDGDASPALQERFTALAESAERAADAAPRGSPRRVITTGVGEPFMVTLTVAAYAALLLSLPVLLFQIYAFVLPAFSPRERQVALPLMAMIPFLFVAGATFAYFVVLPNAISFLANFNDDNFDILLQARDYYRFCVMVLIAIGLLFQIPVGVLAVTRSGIVSVAQLRSGRRYAILVIAVLAMLLPGTDPVTMILAMLPLVVLYEGSILLAALLDRRAERQEAAAGVEPD